MTDESIELKLKSIMGLALLAQEHSMVETQAIEQLLVKKEVCTAAEFRDMRNIVFANSPTVKKVARQIDDISEEIDKLVASIDNKNKFGKLMMDALDGRDLTAEEKIYLYNSLYPEINKEDESND